MSHHTLDSPVKQPSPKVGNFVRRAALTVGALFASAALAIGGASAAQAATINITNGHNDILKIETISGSNVPGSERSDGSFHSWPLADDYVYQFSTANAGVSCSAGLYTISNVNSSTSPDVGFDNSTGTNYSVALVTTGGTVSFASTSFSIASGGLETLPSNTHVHGTWTLTADDGDCGGDSFGLNFLIPGAGSAGTQAFTFTIS